MNNATTEDTRILVHYSVRLSCTGSEHAVPRAEALRLLRAHFRRDGGLGFREYKIPGHAILWNLCPGLYLRARAERFPT